MTSSSLERKPQKIHVYRWRRLWQRSVAEQVEAPLYFPIAQVHRRSLLDNSSMGVLGRGFYEHGQWQNFLDEIATLDDGAGTVSIPMSDWSASKRLKELCARDLGMGMRGGTTCSRRHMSPHWLR